VQVLSEDAFYFFYMALLATYALGISGIAFYVYDMGNSRTKSLTYLVLLTIWYSGMFFGLLGRVPGMWRLGSFLNPVLGPDGLLTWGVAEQYVLGEVFQPSTFGVFIVISILLFLHRKPFASVACLAIAATFHATYLLSAAALTCAYMVVIVIEDKNYRKALLLGAIALVLVTPILAYSVLSFGPSSTENYAQAQNILVDYRIPHHTQISNWFGLGTLFQIMAVALSIYLVRHTRLFLVLLVPFLIASILTVVQVLTGNKSLALLFPWRISVFLVPIASSVILAGVVSVAFQIFNRPISRFARPLQAAILAVIFILGYVGISRTFSLLNTPGAGHTASTRFVARTFEHGSLYLIQPNIETFRLAAKVPILVDYKSHPYQETEIIEWFSRIEIARDFYASTGDAACSKLRGISDKYKITHVLLGTDSSSANCEMLANSYKDAEFAIYEVRGH